MLRQRCRLDLVSRSQQEEERRLDCRGQRRELVDRDFLEADFLVDHLLGFRHEEERLGFHRKDFHRAVDHRVRIE